MKGLILALSVLLTGIVQADKSDILGLWKSLPSEKGYSHIKIEKVGKKYFGTVVYLSKPKYEEKDGVDLVGKEKLDRNNPEKSKQKNPIIGLQLLKNFEYDGDNEWDDGTIYDPNNGKTYKCVIKNKVKDKLYVRGYIGLPIIGRTTTWTRVAPEKIEKTK